MFAAGIRATGGCSGMLNVGAAELDDDGYEPWWWLAAMAASGTN